MKLPLWVWLLIILLAVVQVWFTPVSIHAEDQSTSELAQLREENAKLSKLVQAWQRQAIGCMTQAINTQALAPQPAPVKEKQQ